MITDKQHRGGHDRAGQLHRRVGLGCSAFALLLASSALADKPASDSSAKVAPSNAATPAAGKPPVASETKPAANPAKAAPAPAQGARPVAAKKRGSKPESAADQARKVYGEAEAAFAAGEYQKAIDLFHRADELSPKPEFEYNIALAYDQMGDAAGALAAYRSYLRRAPDSPDRDEVVAQIERLQHQLGRKAQQQITVNTEPEGATVLVDAELVGIAPWTGELSTGRHQVVARHDGRRDARRNVSLSPDAASEVTLILPLDPDAEQLRQAALSREPQQQFERPGVFQRIRPLTWGFVGAGAAGLVGAAAFEQARANSEDDARMAQTQVVAQHELDRAEGHQTTSRVLLGVGAGFAVLGGVFLYIDLNRPTEQETQLAAGCLSHGCGVYARGRF